MDKVESSDSNQKKDLSEPKELEKLSSSEPSKQKTKPRKSVQKKGHPKQKEPRKISTSEKVAWITLLGVIVTVLFSSPIIKCWLQPYTCEPPPPTSTLTPTITKPTISILSVQSNGQPVNSEYAPHDILVRGNVSNANGHYLYLIVVDDGGVKWVQPPLGLISGDNSPFSGHCFLGAKEDDPLAQNKTYIIYAVVSDNGIYKVNDHPTNQPMLATSESIILVRRNLPTPTP